MPTDSLPGPTTDYGVLMPVTVHFDDLDAFGILHNSRYGVLAERAWAAFWQQHGLAYSADWQLLDDGFHVVKELRISFEAPVDRAGPYGMHLWVERLGRTSMTYGFRLCSADGQRTYARGSRTLVRLDRETMRPTEWSGEGREIADRLRRPDH
jgi:acyl-CoA thioester hydrolase